MGQGHDPSTSRSRAPAAKRTDGGTGGDGRPTVLVVDDEVDVAELYSLWLEGNYDVRTATSGEAALDRLDEEVDVALLDRRMGDVSGDRVLDHIRKADFSCRVAMVTAVEPDFDVIEMGFDDYLTKPVNAEALRETVDELVARASYDEDVRRLYALASKKAALEAAKSRAELEESEAYQSLRRELEEVRERADRSLEQSGDFETVLQEV